jgi:hypothetical protein
MNIGLNIKQTFLTSTCRNTCDKQTAYCTLRIQYVGRGGSVLGHHVAMKDGQRGHFRYFFVVALDGKRQLYAPKVFARATRIIVGSEHIGKAENSVLAWVQFRH